jgi:amidohydrolase
MFAKKNPIGFSHGSGQYLQHVKGAFFNTDAQNPELDATYPHHHPKFNIDEKGMLIAAKTLGVATLTYLNKNK